MDLVQSPVEVGEDLHVYVVVLVELREEAGGYLLEFDIGVLACLAFRCYVGPGSGHVADLPHPVGVGAVRRSEDGFRYELAGAVVIVPHVRYLESLSHGGG